MATNIYQKKLIELRKSSGLCVDCGKPLDRNGYRCISCNNRQNLNHALEREYYQAKHVCPRCRRNSILGDEKVCPECSAKGYILTMNSRNKEHYNLAHGEWAKKEYQRRKENGICTRCGNRKADYGFFTCGICRNKDRQRKRIKYGKPSRKERYKIGMCYFCDNPVKEGYKVCEKHYQMNMEKAHSEGADMARNEIKKIENRRIQNEQSK